MKITTTLAIGLAALALPATMMTTMATPQQFDLVCKGQTSTTSRDIKPIESTDDARYSVDLGQKVWWRHQKDASPRPLPIAALGGDVLKLRDESGPQGENRIEIDTKSGAYSALIRVRSITADIVATTKGRCTLAPLTPGIL